MKALKGFWRSIVDFFTKPVESPAKTPAPDTAPPPVIPSPVVAVPTPPPPIKVPEPQEPIETPPVTLPTSVDLVKELIDSAKKWQHIKETDGKNRQKDIDAWNKAMKVPLGSPWCMSFVQSRIKDIESRYGVASRVFKSAHCLTVWNQSPQNLKDSIPNEGDLIIWNKPGTTNGHVGIVTKVLGNGYVETIEGNTSSGSLVERNGDGVYIKKRHINGDGHFKVKGYLKVWDARIVEV